MADEGSGAHLKAIVYPYNVVSKIPLQAAIQGVNSCFIENGLPENLKIDNGLPFVNPVHMDVPTKAKLWWIGLGIKVIQNTPACPQENGIVECLQGTMNSWSNPKDQINLEALQQRLDEESDFQCNYYRLLNRGGKTRAELYPELALNKRRYNPDNFDIKEIYNYLSLQVWERRIKKGGAVKFFSHEFYIGRKYAHLTITVTFDPIEKQWLFRKTDGTLLKTALKGVPSESKIKEFALMSMNFDTT